MKTSQLKRIIQEVLKEEKLGINKTEFPTAKEMQTYLFDTLSSMKAKVFFSPKNDRYVSVKLPYKFKPTIAKFAEEGEFFFYVDREKKKVGSYKAEWNESFDGTQKHEELDDYKKDTETAKIIRTNYKYMKEDEQNRFNKSSGNNWHY